MKGRIDTEMLKDRLERDLLQNMKMAEKMGVFSVLRDMHYDAKEKMSWRDRHRERMNNGEQPIVHMSSSFIKPTADPKTAQDAGLLEESQFPGYEERLG